MSEAPQYLDSFVAIWPPLHECCLDLLDAVELVQLETGCTSVDDARSGPTDGVAEGEGAGSRSSFCFRRLGWKYPTYFLTARQRRGDPWSAMETLMRSPEVSLQSSVKTIGHCRECNFALLQKFTARLSLTATDEVRVRGYSETSLNSEAAALLANQAVSSGTSDDARSIYVVTNRVTASIASLQVRVQSSGEWEDLWPHGLAPFDIVLGIEAKKLNFIDGSVQVRICSWTTFHHSSAMTYFS